VATNVTQVTPVDTTFVSHANYGNMREFQIPGQSAYSESITTYIIDDTAEVVYEFNFNNDTLDPTGGDYDAFIAFLAANAVTATVAPPPAATATSAVLASSRPPTTAVSPAAASRVSDSDSQLVQKDILVTLRAMHAALVALVTEGGRYLPGDFSLESPEYSDEFTNSRFS